jgi:iron complex outermembrane receptor protein
MMIFKEKVSSYSVRLALSMLAGTTLLAGQTHAQVATGDSAATPQKVEITGSNIKRTEKEGVSSIQVISVKEIRESGAKTVLELLKQVPALGTNGYNDTSNQNGFSRGVATASLRNLGSTSTLILLNGRRLAPSAYANPNNGTSTLYDLNAIPISALERVEVFKDGASAVYGSDAIGGVINFITKKDYTGGEVAVNVGANDDNEFRRQNINATVGFGSLEKNGYNLFLSADYSRRDRTSIRDGSNDIEQKQYAAINFRLSPFSSSVSSSPIFYKEKAPGTNSYPVNANSVITLNCDPSRILVGGPQYNILPSNTSLTNRKFCNYDLDQFTEAQNKGEDLNLLSIGTLKISNDVTAFAEAAFTKSDRFTTAAPRTISGTAPTTNFLVGGLAAPFQAVLPIGHPDNPFSNARAAVSYRFENIPGGNDLTNKSIRLLGGLRGDIGTNWSWETAALWNESKRDETNFGFLYLPTLRTLITQNRSLASLAADPTITRPITNNGTSSVAQWDAKISGEFGHLAGGAIGVAAGVEYRNEKIDIQADPTNARGEILGLATTAVTGSRNVESGYFEVRLPFLKNWEVEGAGRFDKYPNLKANFVPKIGTKWDITKSVAVRSSYSEGFRAPAVSQISPGGAQFFLNNTIDPIRCPNGVTPLPGAEQTDCAKSISGVGGANPDLKPETSKSYSAGLIIAPSSKFEVTIDYFKVRKEGEVALSDSTYILNHPNLFPNSITRDTNPANFLVDANGKVIPNSGQLLAVATPWTNQGSTETSGIDLNVKFENSLGKYGKLSTNLNSTYTLSYRRAEQPGDIERNVVGADGGLSDFATSSPRIPRVKGRISTAWELDSHTATLAVNYVSQISLLRRSDNDVVYPVPYCQYGSGQPSTATGLGGSPLYNTYHPDCAISSWTTVDAGYSYTGFKNLTLGLSILNILDSKAPYAPPSSTTTATLGYDAGLHNGTGRYFNLSARYSFK